MSTAAVHSHPAKVEAVYTLTRQWLKARPPGLALVARPTLYSQGFFQEPCCVKTTPPMPTYTQKFPSEVAVSEDRQTGGAEGAWEEQVEAR